MPTLCKSVVPAAFLAVALTWTVQARGAYAGDTNGHTLDEAWWTGPLLASSAATLAPGAAVIEIFAFDTKVKSRFDGVGSVFPAPRSETVASLAELFLGISNRLTAGIFMRLASKRTSGAATSTVLTGLGDTSLQMQYELHAENPGGSLPTVSMVLSETVPTGKYDNISNGTGDGFGAGAYTSTIALYSQRIFSSFGERLVRERLDVSFSVSGSVGVRNASVYGTLPGFRGTVQPGPTFETDGATEYSVTRRWVLAIDLDYLHVGSTRIVGQYQPIDERGFVSVISANRIGASDLFSVAPAIEYNLSGDLGVIAGVQIPVAGRNVGAGNTLMIAVNMSF